MMQNATFYATFSIFFTKNAIASDRIICSGRKCSMCRILFVTLAEAGKFEKMFKKVYMTELQHYLNSRPEFSNIRMEFYFYTDPETYKRNKRNADVLVARGIRAIILREHEKEKPVIEIPISTADFLFSIKQISEKSTIDPERPMALVHSSRDVFIQSDQVRNYLNLNIVPVHYTDHALDPDYNHELFRDLKQQGIDQALCFSSLHDAALDQQIRPYHIRSTSESLFSALRDAMYTISDCKNLNETTINKIVQNASEGLILLDNRNRVINLNKHAQHIINSCKTEIEGTDILDHDFISSATSAAGNNNIETLNNSIINDYRVNTFPFLYNTKNIGTVLRLSQNRKKKTFVFNESKTVKPVYRATHNFDDIIHTSSIMNNAITTAKSFAQIDSSILILGATGTGKELFAQSIHNFSQRRRGPFVAVNCAAIPDSLFESEFFGHTSGSFTGAQKNGHTGYFEQASGGTIFLDEISEISIQLQSKLLRVIQENQIIKVGGTRPVNLDIRFLYGVNRNLRTLVYKGDFRKDLYFRISSVRLPLPHLKERGQDIILLFEHYIDLFSKRFGTEKRLLTDDAKEILLIHEWPGNIRELMNLCEHLAATARNTCEISSREILQIFSMEQDILDNCLSEENSCPATTEKTSSLKDLEKQSIINALIKSGNKKNKAALLLGINRSTLWRKIKEYKIQ